MVNNKEEWNWAARIKPGIIIEFVKNNPNDDDLGKKVRSYVNKLRKKDGQKK